MQNPELFLGEGLVFFSVLKGAMQNPVVFLGGGAFGRLKTMVGGYKKPFRTAPSAGFYNFPLSNPDPGSCQRNCWGSALNSPH